MFHPPRSPHRTWAAQSSAMTMQPNSTEARTSKAYRPTAGSELSPSDPPFDKVCAVSVHIFWSDPASTIFDAPVPAETSGAGLRLQAVDLTTGRLSEGHVGTIQ